MKRLCLLSLSLLTLLSLTACSSQEPPAARPAARVQGTIHANVPARSSPAQAPGTSHPSAIDQQEEPMNQTAPVGQENPSSPEKSEGGKTLIAYFSLIDIVPAGADAATYATPSIGNTESAAMEIQKQVGGDLFAIRTMRSYPVSHRESSSIAEEEMRDNARPALSTHVENMNAYDTIYIGYPIWWYMEPMAIRTFLEEYDMTGKTIIPFCTSMGAGIGESEDNITALSPGAKVLKGITLRTGQGSHREEIAAWLSDLGMTK